MLKRGNAKFDRAAGELLQAVIDNMAEAVVTIDASGRIISFSRAAERMFGYDEDGVRGHNVSMLMPSPHREAHDGYLQRYRETGVGQILGVRSRELMARRRDGSEFDVELTVGEVEGAPTRMFVGVLRDISERVRVRRLLAESEDKLRKLFELSSLGIARNAMDGRFLEANPALLEMLGYTLEELNRLTYWDLTPDSYAPDEARQIENLNQTGAYGPYEKEYIHRSGRRISVQLSGNLITGGDGEKYIWSIVEDVTGRRAAEKVIQASEARLAALVNSLPVVLAVIDRDETFLLFRGQVGRGGFDPDSIVGRSVAETLQDFPEIQQHFRRALEGETLTAIIWNDGAAHEVHYSPMVGSAGAIIGAIAISLNVTEREEHTALLHRQANFDDLTGLPNRTAFRARLTEGLLFAEQPDTQCAVIIIDIDHFKRINATRGQEAGDHLLIKAGDRLAGLVGDGGVAARLGGDQFAILLTGLPAGKARPAALDMAHRVAAMLHLPFENDGGFCQLTAGIGIAIGAQDDSTPDQLLRRADTALHVAKEEGCGRPRLFEPAMDQHIQQLVAIDTQLHRALERNELSLVYQPIIDTVSGQTVKFEALLRWTNAELGTVPPDLFIPIAEDNGQIVPIGAWVLRQAAADMANRERVGGGALTVSVNVSARQMADGDFLEHVHAALDMSGLTARQLELELTERLLISHDEQMQLNIERLRALGVAFSVDDFGVGYSSFSYLTRLPLQSIKIDRSFVDGVEHNLPNRETIRAILALARSLGMQVVCEGVETAAAASLLRELGCHLQQGYFHGRPCPKAEIANDEPMLAATSLAGAADQKAAGQRARPGVVWDGIGLL